MTRIPDRKRRRIREKIRRKALKALRRLSDPARPLFTRSVMRTTDGLFAGGPCILIHAHLVPITSTSFAPGYVTIRNGDATADPLLVMISRHDSTGVFPDDWRCHERYPKLCAGGLYAVFNGGANKQALTLDFIPTDEIPWLRDPIPDIEAAFSTRSVQESIFTEGGVEPPPEEPTDPLDPASPPRTEGEAGTGRGGTLL